MVGLACEWVGKKQDGCVSGWGRKKVSGVWASKEVPVDERFEKSVCVWVGQKVRVHL